MIAPIRTRRDELTNSAWGFTDDEWNQATAEDLEEENTALRAENERLRAELERLRPDPQRFRDSSGKAYTGGTDARPYFDANDDQQQEADR